MGTPEGGVHHYIPQDLSLGLCYRLRTSIGLFNQVRLGQQVEVNDSGT